MPIKHPKGYWTPLGLWVSGWVRDFLQTPHCHFTFSFRNPLLIWVRNLWDITKQYTSMSKIIILQKWTFQCSTQNRRYYFFRLEPTKKAGHRKVFGLSWFPKFPKLYKFVSKFLILNMKVIWFPKFPWQTASAVRRRLLKLFILSCPWQTAKMVTAYILEKGSELTRKVSTQKVFKSADITSL